MKKLAEELTEFVNLLPLLIYFQPQETFLRLSIFTALWALAFSIVFLMNSV